MTSTLVPSASRILSDDAIARAPRRVEGRGKVTGALRYAGDLGHDTFGPDLHVAVAIISPQASGRILEINADEALRMPGVRALLSHQNAPRLHKVMSLTKAEIGDILPLQDDVIRYGGQCVALLVANTLENARAAARLVQIRYSQPEPHRAIVLGNALDRAEECKQVGGGDPGRTEVGKPDEAFAAATHQVDLTFETPPHHHNAMEPGAIVAAWDDDEGLTVHLPTQFTYGDALVLGQAFRFGLKDRLPRIVAQVLGGIEFDNKVRVISTMAGGAFGSKIGNVHLLLAPMAAKVADCPVKLVLSRQQVFTMMPFRGATHQRLRLGADADGRLQALIQDAIVSQGAGGQYVEPAVEIVPKSYACPNMRVNTKAVRLDLNAPGWMRGPGACIGAFALETAVDQLAYEMGVDPLEFRLRNHADVEPDTGHEWSSKSLKECYEAAGRRIGWFERKPAIGSMREGRHLVGYGMASSLYPVRQMPAAARVCLHADGRATVQSAMHEIGQGAITSMTQVAADALGLPLAHVTFELGDTRLPYGGMTVGSMSTLTNATPIHDSACTVRKALLKRATKDQGSPFYACDPSELDVMDGRVVASNGRSEAVAEVMARHPDGQIVDESISRAMGNKKLGRQTFGAQFAKVLIDPETMHLQVQRLIGAFAGGRAVNPLLVHSQVMGGMVWGLGQALVEETVPDERKSMWMNRSLAEALVPTNADVDGIEAIVIEEDDTRGHPLGIKGMGEIGVIGTPAAIGNAIFHATGIRLTELPFRIDRLLAGAASKAGPASRAGRPGTVC